MEAERTFVDADALVVAQEAVGRAEPTPWTPSREPLRTAGCFVAFARGEQGPGRAGDHAWVGAAIVDEDGTTGASLVTRGTAGDSYRPGLLALREGQLLLDALRALVDAIDAPPDVVLVDATGRDHPRRCGLAVHLGYLLGLPTVGVTHRLLEQRHAQPPPLGRRGEAAPIVAADGRPVAAWVCTASGVRPVAAHAAWRTDVDTAITVVMRTSGAARTPEPLRAAKEAARAARSAADRRA